MDFNCWRVYHIETGYPLDIDSEAGLLLVECTCAVQCLCFLSVAVTKVVFGC